ncbi:hypothetical protein G4B88_020778, partial [Cannabis sativa]
EEGERSGGAGEGGGVLELDSMAVPVVLKRAENVRKINRKVSPQEASSIARNLYDVIKEHGPLTIPNAWVHAKDSGVGQNTYEAAPEMDEGKENAEAVWSTGVGSSKKFLLSTLPEDPKVTQIRSDMEVKIQHKKPSSSKGKKKTR